MGDKIRLVPYPQKVTVGDGYLDCAAVAVPDGDCVNGIKLSDVFEKYGMKTHPQGVAVRCEKVEKEARGEWYSLSVSENGVTMRAGTDAGLLYAAVSLAQLADNYRGRIPVCEIEDFPTTAYRGFMLDSGRYFFPKEDVLRLVDLCVLHKLNAFHWHLTEDQGWRMQSEKYPLLTDKGSKRSHTNFGIRPHGGYYTKEDMAEVVDYCRRRNISVIPEIDVPGHSVAALACYPWLGCFDRKLKVATHSGVKHDVMCAGKESTYAFVCDIVDEMAETFGGNTAYIHIGGDEVPATRWKICPHCRAKMKELGLRDEKELQAYFMNRIAEHVVAKGYIPVVWNGNDLSLPLNEKAVVQIWTSDSGASVADTARFAAKHGGFINSDSGYAYLDLPYAYTDLAKSYSFEPLPEGVDSDRFIGAEAALWTEYVPDLRSACKRVLPRLCALAEAMWNKCGGTFSAFRARLRYFEKYLSGLGYEGADEAQAMPGRVSAFFRKLWFERRQLHWQGLHNIIDNAAVKIRYRKKER